MSAARRYVGRSGAFTLNGGDALLSSLHGRSIAQGPSKATATSKASKKKTIEQTYQKLTQLEHVLLRPDTYIGSTQRQQQQLWVHDGERLVNRAIQVSPGLYKIFDEILVNAADNKIRDPTMSILRVDVDEVRGGTKQCCVSG